MDIVHAIGDTLKPCPSERADQANAALLIGGALLAWFALTLGVNLLVLAAGGRVLAHSSWMVLALALSVLHRQRMSSGEPASP